MAELIEQLRADCGGRSPRPRPCRPSRPSVRRHIIPQRPILPPVPLVGRILCGAVCTCAHACGGMRALPAVVFHWVALARRCVASHRDPRAFGQCALASLLRHSPNPLASHLIPILTVNVRSHEAHDLFRPFGSFWTDSVVLCSVLGCALLGLPALLVWAINAMIAICIWPACRHLEETFEQARAFLLHMRSAMGTTRPLRRCRSSAPGRSFE